MGDIPQKLFRFERVRACDPHQAPAKECRDSVGEAKDLLIVRGHKDHRQPLVGELAQMAIDLRPSADIDATRGLFDEKDGGLNAQPLAERNLLLIAAGQFRSVSSEASGIDLKKVGELSRNLDLARSAQEAAD